MGAGSLGAIVKDSSEDSEKLCIHTGSPWLGLPTPALNIQLCFGPCPAEL